MLVEGPLDAVAVTLAGDGRYIGVAPSARLSPPPKQHSWRDSRSTRSSPPTQTPPDASPRTARTGYSPAMVSTPATHPWMTNLDPAATLHQHGPHSLRHALEQAGRLGDRLIRDLADATSAPSPTAEALRILAARPPHTWTYDSTASESATR